MSSTSTPLIKTVTITTLTEEVRMRRRGVVVVVNGGGAKQQQQRRKLEKFSAINIKSKSKYHQSNSLLMVVVMVATIFMVISCLPVVTSFMVSSNGIHTTSTATKQFKLLRSPLPPSRVVLMPPPPPPSSSSSSRSSSSRPSYSSSVVSSRLYMSGRGIAKNYTWREEAFEIEITVTVPKQTKAKDISFKATSTSIGLTMKKKPSSSSSSSTTTSLTSNDSSGDDEQQQQTSIITLLDPKRKLRGRVVVDGTYWEISDDNPDKNDNDDDKDDDDSISMLQNLIPKKYVTVTIEKLIRTPKNDMDVVDYDWYGVYSVEDENEVTYRKYDEPEKLNVKEYAQTLGVDIDNINMSLVDKTMFTSGLNLTQSSIDSLKTAGYLQQDDIVEQKDGKQWITNEDGEPVPYYNNNGGNNNDDPTRTTTTTTTTAGAGAAGPPKKKIPFIDTDSPWNKNTISVDELKRNMQKQKERDQQQMEEDEDDDDEEEDDDDDDDDRFPFVTKDTGATDNKQVGGEAKTNSSPSHKQQSDVEKNSGDTEQVGNDTAKTAASSTTEDKQNPNDDGSNRDMYKDDIKDPIGTLTVARLKDILRAQGLKVSGNKTELQQRLRDHVQSMLKKGNGNSDNDGTTGNKT